MPAAATIYTLGHSNHTLELFLALLKQHRFATVVDVRSKPYSRWAPHFRKVSLARSLRDAAIDYVFLGGELGGRPEGREFYDREGRLDVERRRQARDFQDGIERLARLACLACLACLGRSARTVLLCAEENPVRCHRRVLVTPSLEEIGFTVVHVRGDGRLQPEAELRPPTLF